MSRFLLIFCIILFASCQEVSKKAVNIPEKKAQKESSVRKYISKYVKHDSDLSYEDSIFHSQQPKPVGDVNGDGNIDSVFVMPLLHDKDTFAYYFLDTSIPRLTLYYSYCAENDYIFPVKDIDEDGRNELGILQHTCNSRTQTLFAYSLRNGAWRRIGECTYDMNFEDILPMQERIVKTGKGKFKMLHVNYDAVNDTLVKDWRRLRL